LSNGQTLVNSDTPKELGDVELPELNLKYEANLKPVLEKMGLNRIFTSMSSLLRLSPQGAMLIGVSQTVDMKLDKEGIHAHAFTFSGGHIGGIFGGVASMPTPSFHMVVNRPFLFFIHDTYTDSLLFAGAVVDPNKN
jgi:serpin B